MIQSVKSAPFHNAPQSPLGMRLRFTFTAAPERRSLRYPAIIRLVIDFVARHYDLDPDRLTSPSHKDHLSAEARHVAMVFAADLIAPLSHRHLVPFFNRERSMIPHARRRFKDLCSSDPLFRANMIRLRADLMKALALAASADPVGAMAALRSNSSFTLELSSVLRS